MARLEAVANVALRVPGLALLDLLYRWDAAALAELLRPRRGDPPLLRPPALWGGYCLGHVLCVVLLVLPVRSLVKLYLHLLTALLLGAGHAAARDYIRRELEYGFHGAVYSDPAALGRFATALAGQLCLCTLCSLLMRSRRPWLFAAPLLPVLARLCGLPLRALPGLDTFAAVLTALEVLYVLGSHVLVPFRLLAAACREVVQALEVYRLVALAASLWSQLAVPLLFLVFWLVLFSLRLSSFLTSSGSPLAQQGLLFLLLSSAAECCSTPYSLVGLTFTVSYLALGVLNLCKFYLLGFGAFQNGNVMHRGVTEGVTLLLLALQTGLLDLQILQRTFLLSIILFIVVTSTLQSMIEIADPIVLALGASRNRSPWKHFRGVSMCLFLLVFPCFMAYKIAHFFHLDFWLLILVSSCMLTSLQVMGTLFIYALFMVELLQDTPLERMDEIIYCVNAVSRVLEFLVAVCVVGYGTWESLFGEWSWMGASVIIIHSYFNVWLRAQSGWRSFLLRREAAKKINSLPQATGGQLRDHNDVCAICFQDMQVAVITPCSHFFHAACLRKWLYVQDTCPMCHQQVTPVAAEEDPGSGRVARPAPAGGDEVPEDGGAAASPAPARPQEAELPGGDGVVPEQGDSGASQDSGAGHLGPHHPAHPHASAPQEREAGAVPQPHGDPRPLVRDTQHPSPSPAGPELGAGASGDSHSGHPPS
ncbi:RING finger protein 145-like [Mycteria americana]|uniref:RING finger protein 145-like n=1 Tax=Mycteria americana TaxID=33587 RepID=UPI003F589939